MTKKTYVVPLGNKTLFMKKFESVYISGTNYIFLGDVKDLAGLESIPSISCFFVYTGEDLAVKFVEEGEEIVKVYPKNSVHFRSPKKGPENITRVISRSPKPSGTPRTVTPGDNQLLKLEIHPEDDELMVRVKSLLINRKVTVGQFKEMYGTEEKDKINMNNDKSRLEGNDKHTLSYSKFKHITGLLGFAHHIELFKMEDNDEAS